MIPSTLSSYVENCRSIFSFKSDNLSSNHIQVYKNIILSNWKPVYNLVGSYIPTKTENIWKGDSVIIPFSTSNGDFILKIGMNNTNYELHVAEWASNQVKENGTKTPSIVVTDTSRYLVPLDFQIQERINGAPLTKYVSEKEAQNQLHTAARQLSHAHQCHIAGYGHLDPTALFLSIVQRPRGIFNSWTEFLNTQFLSHINYCEQIGAINEMEAGKIESLGKRFARLEDTFTPTLLHNDLNPENIFIHEDEIFFLDWSDAIVGDPIFDLANMCAFHMPERFQAITDGYFNSSRRPENFDETFWLYYLRIVLSRTVHRHKCGIKDKDAYPPASRRIQLALENLA